MNSMGAGRQQSELMRVLGRRVTVEVGREAKDTVLGWLWTTSAAAEGRFRAVVEHRGSKPRRCRLEPLAGGLSAIVDDVRYNHAGVFVIGLNVEDGRGRSAAARAIVSVGTLAQRYAAALAASLVPGDPTRVVAPSTDSPPMEDRQAAAHILASPQFQRHFVASALAEILGRDSAREIRRYSLLLSQGHSLASIQAAILTSAQYRKQFRTQAAYVDGVYQFILGRPPFPSEIYPAASRRPSDTAIVEALQAKSEAQIRVASRYLRTILGVEASPQIASAIADDARRHPQRFIEGVIEAIADRRGPASVYWGELKASGSAAPQAPDPRAPAPLGNHVPTPLNPRWLDPPILELDCQGRIPNSAMPSPPWMREHTFGTANIFWARNASVRGLTSLLNDHFDENPVWEWLPVGPYISPFFTSPWDSDGVCVSGYAVHPHDSVADVPFTHPFTEGGGSSERGNDWNFYIAVDADYNDLLSPCNNDLDGCAPQLGPTDEDNVQAIGIARLRKDQIDPVTKLPGLGLNVAGVLGFEVDGGLVPLILASSGQPAPLRDQYRVAHGDRVIVVGRWIIDCGHDNFATEIHPPLLLIRGFRPIMPDGSADPDTTVCNIISRPFLVDQNFAYYDREIAGYGGPTIRTGRGLRQEIEGQLGSIYWWGGRVQLHTPLLQPFIGSHFIRFTLHPGVARRSPTDQLSVTGSFTVRSGVGILLIGNPGDDSLDVLISLDAAHYAAPQKPPSHVITVTEDELLASLPADKAQVLRDTLQRFKNMSGNIRSAIEAGAQMDVYDAPIPVSPADGSNALNQVPIGEVLGESPTALDDTQLYPVYGSVRLVWKRG